MILSELSFISLFVCLFTFLFYLLQSSEQNWELNMRKQINNPWENFYYVWNKWHENSKWFCATVSDVRLDNELSIPKYYGTYP